MTRNATRFGVKYGRSRSTKARQLIPSPLVLLVERELHSRLNNANELLDQGYDVVESENASEAMNILRGRNDFDAMVADIDAEHIQGGLALVRYAANHHPSMKLLVSSTKAELLLDSEGIAAAFFPKPLRAGDLARRLRKLLGHGAAVTIDALPTA